MCNLLDGRVAVKKYGIDAGRLGNNQDVFSFDIIFVDKAGQSLVSAEIVRF